MKCPVCVKQDKKSRVFPGTGSVTCMGHQPYFDEDGVYHSHDPNWHNVSYSCSEGHKWSRSYRLPCTAPGCDFAKDDDSVTIHD